jgi:hypothetical protein
MMQKKLHLGYPAMEPQEGVHQPGVRFLGQCTADMEVAEQAALALKLQQEKECEMVADMLGLQMPGVLLNAGQSMRIWVDHIVKQLAPPDFVELCQVAAMQQNRYKLFREPFP